VDLPQRPVAARLLHELAEQAGKYVPKRDLFVRLLPEDVSSKTLQAFEPERLERRLRQLKSELTALLTRDAENELPSEPIDQQRGSGGGIRLHLDPSRVCWLSHPAHVDAE
jgi:hypothetical protein